MEVTKLPQSKINGIPSHGDFVKSVAAAKEADYSNRPSYSADNSAAFEEMKAHLLQMAEGVEVLHSFINDHGQVFDCIPIGQQASLKGKNMQVAAPVDIKLPRTEVPAQKNLMQAPLKAARNDKFGNVMQCPEGTIPVRRVTLDEISRFGTLREFFQKPPGRRGRHPHLNPPEAPTDGHKYAHAYQGVINLGGHSFINIWDPAVGSQVFSLAQHWYSGGSPLQTAECGWQVYPQKYQTTQPVLFIYWTADYYDKTGCYNLDGSGFVQTNNAWPLGGVLSASSAGGPQFELEVCYCLVAGNWWLYINGTSAGDAIGYYPTALYNGGQMASNATDIDYGGETLEQSFWPPMGSGAFAAQGYQQAAYQRDIYYFDSTGSPQPAVLNPQQPSPSCFSLQLSNDPDPWNVNFYFGGPGGSGCE